jgi:formyltetrahydrofolate hydrolase
VSQVNHYILKIDCKDEQGLIYRIADVVFKYQLNIVKNDEFVDPEKARFFMRAEVSGEMDIGAFQGTLRAMLPSDAAIYVSVKRKKNIVLMGTKESHCLGDILLKHDSNDLNANILAIVANHDDLRPLAGKFDIPFHYISHANVTR